MRPSLAVAIAALAACSPGAGDPPELAALDPVAYARDVHPIFEARCATLDCHGQIDRPLRLYAQTGLRARDDLRDQPIEDSELTANQAAVAALDPGERPADSLVARKPLDDDAGGVAHEGGALWRAGDAQHLCLLAWLEGRSDEPAAIDACQVAAGEVALPP
jgi:hypothetical protein